MDYSALSEDDLVAACFQTGNELAWIEFVRRFQPLIARVAIRIARNWGEHSSQVVDDLVQDTYLKLCGERTSPLRNFRSAHKDALYGYIKVFTANLVQDHFKAQRSDKRGGTVVFTGADSEMSLDAIADPMAAACLIERDVLLQQIDSCLEAALTGPNSERDRKIFWLYYRAGLAASAIASLPTMGLTTKGVESTVGRLTRQVRRQLAAGPRVGTQRSEGTRSAESFHKE
jgi:RNA polymerase sigma-70 factor (ECF subfamily)